MLDDVVQSLYAYLSACIEIYGPHIHTRTHTRQTAIKVTRGECLFVSVAYAIIAAAAGFGIIMMCVLYICYCYITSLLQGMMPVACCWPKHHYSTKKKTENKSVQRWQTTKEEKGISLYIWHSRQHVPSHQTRSSHFRISIQLLCSLSLPFSFCVSLQVKSFLSK